MRILLTTHAFLPRSVAGVEVYTARLARALQDLGHTVRILTATHDLAASPHSVRRTVVGSLEVVEIVNPHLDGTLQATYRVPAIDRAIDSIVAEFRPECVHVQHVLNLSTGLFEAAARSGACLVLTLHDYWLSCPRDGLRMRSDGELCGRVDHDVCARCLLDSPYLVAPIQRGVVSALRRAGLGRALHAVHQRAPGIASHAMRVARALWGGRRPRLVRDLAERARHLRDCVQRADAVLVPTRFALDRAFEWGVSQDRARMMPLGAVVDPLRPRLPGPRRRFGYLGTVAPHKGVHTLVEAFRGLTRQDLTLDVFGNERLDPPYARRLRALASDDARIRFRGVVADGEQARVFSAVDVLVLPSIWWENSPLALLEALAAGVPVVASRTGGLPEIVPEGAGVLVPPGDVEALRVAMAEVASGGLLGDPLGPLPLKTTRDGAQELEALYSRLLGQRRAP
jgi:glycosyltransferase involved in cell wall biosynthesis